MRRGITRAFHYASWSLFYFKRSKDLSLENWFKLGIRGVLRSGRGGTRSSPRPPRSACPGGRGAHGFTGATGRGRGQGTRGGGAARGIRGGGGPLGFAGGRGGPGVEGDTAEKKGGDTEPRGRGPPEPASAAPGAQLSPRAPAAAPSAPPSARRAAPCPLLLRRGPGSNNGRALWPRPGCTASHAGAALAFPRPSCLFFCAHFLQSECSVHPSTSLAAGATECRIVAVWVWEGRAGRGPGGLRGPSASSRPARPDSGTAPPGKRVEGNQGTGLPRIHSELGPWLLYWRGLTGPKTQRGWSGSR